MSRNYYIERFGLFTKTAPRYTSFPTAANFVQNLAPTLLADWLQTIPERSSISVYVHVPYCKHLCWFCACRTQGLLSKRPLSYYLETLLRELNLIENYLPKNIKLSHLHLGGGTPTLLEPSQLEYLISGIYNVFEPNSSTDFSIEIDPTQITSTQIKSLKKYGLNRCSFGVQDFDVEIQRAIGRRQTITQTKAAIELARQENINSINLDLVYGLPLQSPEKMKYTVNRAIEFSPDRVALYGYAHVPWMVARQKMIPAHELPSTRERFNLFELARELLTKANYKQIGIDHFAKPNDTLSIAEQSGELRRNFQGYTTDNAHYLIGIGASSISTFPQGYVQNISATSLYQKTINQSLFAINRGYIFTKRDKIVGNIIEQLMCNFRVNSHDILNNNHITASELTTLFERVNTRFDNLLHISKNELIIPNELKALIRLIALEFDHHNVSTSRYSSAI